MALFRAVLSGAFIAAVLQFSAVAQPYPSKPVRLVLPVPPGGVQDTLARAMAPELAKRWGQPLVIENRSGANGAIATEHIARSAPDGYSILMASSMQVSNDLNAENKSAIDPTKELALVLALVSTGNILITTPQFPAGTLKELIALARSKPGEFNFGSFGIGSSPHLDMQALADINGIKATHIPYKGGADIMQGLLSGQIQFSFAGLQAALPFVRQGRLKAIAYGGLTRSATLPDVPTLSESGMKDFESSGWFGWFAPVATPRPVVDRIAAEVSSLITSPEFRDKSIHGLGFDLLNLPAGPFMEKFRAGREVYAARLKKLGVRNF
jgi:tripartite-type tricarboxylate transporter receptor subunit TctC